MRHAVVGKTVPERGIRGEIDGGLFLVRSRDFGGFVIRELVAEIGKELELRYLV